MENHVYKHHFRHGHHHHKHQTFYALLAMLFFGLVTLGVVASIYYTLDPLRRHQPTNGSVANICIEGAVDCNDTVNGGQLDELQGSVVLQEASGSPRTFSHATANYAITVPAGMEVIAPDIDVLPMDVLVGYPDTMSVLAVSVSENNGRLSLNDALSNVISQMVPDADRQSDIVTSNATIDGVPARRLSVSNWEGLGETVFVAIKNSKVFLIRGSTGRVDIDEDEDVLNLVKTFKFID